MTESPDILRIETLPATSEVALSLIREVSAELAGKYDYATDGSGDFRPHEVLPRSVFLVGFLGDQPVACGAIRPLEEKVAEVKRMYVIPDYRGRGFSKQILMALEEVAREFHYDVVRLETGDRQHAAIGLYQHFGYQPCDPFGIYKSAEHSVCFEKSLRED